jgi:acyl-CoA synthetase (AMP-forming)/AMP-acid ligase II
VTGGVDILALHALGTPDKPALVTEAGEETTYAQLNSRVNRCANVLLSLGLAPGGQCIHVHYNSPLGFEISHALRKIRAINTQMNWRLRGPEVAYILNDSNARVVIAGRDFIEVVDAARADVQDAGSRRWLVLGEDIPAGWESYDELVAAAPDTDPDITSELTGPTMTYTAGTTGNPKGALRRQGVDPSVVLQWIQMLDIRSDDVHLLAGPGYHSAPAVFAGVQQLVGATCVVMRHFDPVRALELIERHRVSTTFMAPILVRRILDLPGELRARYDVSSMRVMIVAAAPFPPDLKRRAQEYFGPSVYEFYGATETGIVTLMTPEDMLRKPESCGRPAAGAEVIILDDDGNEVEQGTPGELWTRSAQVVGEYLNKPEATAGATRDGFFTVGDVAYQDEEGFVYICDRKIDMIISGGANVYPAEVEAALHTHPAVEDCAVIGVPDDEWGEAVKAVVKLRADTTATTDELIAHCRASIAGYKVPRSVDFVEDFPRDVAGKLLKRLVRDPYWAATGKRI